MARHNLLFPFLLPLSITLMLIPASHAQIQRFRHLDINDGLSQNAVSVILQDSRGFIWLGTKDGLNRYDGYEFVIYQYDPFDTASLSANYVTSLAEGEDHKLFVGTASGTVDVFDPSGQTFRQIPLLLGDSSGINRASIHNMKMNNNGELWIGTDGQGIFILDATSPYKVKHHILPEKNARDPASNIGLCFEKETGDRMWVGTGQYLYLMDANGRILETHSIRTKHPDAPSNEMDKAVIQIINDDADQLWLGNLSGLVHFHKKTGKYTLYPHRYNIARYGWAWIADMIQDMNGDIWIPTRSGLLLFDPNEKQYTYIEHDPLDPNSLSFNNLSAIIQDRTGVIWIGTGGMGADLYDLKSERFKLLQKQESPDSRINGFSVRSIVEENDSITWISAGVLYRWNRNNGALQSFESSSSRPDDFGNTEVFSMMRAKNGNLYIGATTGLHIYDPDTKSTQFFKHEIYDPEGLPEDHVFSVLQAQNDSIYLLTENYFCQLLDEYKGRFKCIRLNELQDGMDSESITLIESPRNIFWWGTKGGLIRYDVLNDDVQVYTNDPLDSNSISNNYITVITEDPQQADSILWIGTAGGGLNKMNTRSGKFEHYTEADGLPNNVVYGILPDEQGWLWLSTNKGLIRFDPQSLNIHDYDIHDGLQSNEFNTWAYHKGASGLLYFGGVKGLTYFYPEEVRNNPFYPPIVFTNLKIKGETATHLSHPDILSQPFSEAEEIELTYKDRLVQIEFAALDYSAPEKNQFAYKLEGFDEEWRQAGTQRSATYTNIPPGDYTFLVKGSNNDGLWSEEPARLQLSVLPPWWKSNVAYVTYGLVFLGLMYFFRRYEIKRMHVRNQLKLQEVETNSLRELDQLKTEFFDNISHEFRTPLTLIMGQLESSIPDVDSDLIKQKLRSAQSNSHRLMSLINQLLDLSKLESGKMELKLEEQELIGFLKNLFHAFEQMAKEKDISLAFHSQMEELPMVFDPDKVEKMVINLLSNALKFTPEKGKVMLEVNQADPQYVQISVRDTGPGIAAGEQDMIFDRFYQADGSSTREHEGSGIGLSLVKQLAHIHKGRIELESQKGKGSCFRLFLPVNLSITGPSNTIDRPALVVKSTESSEYNDEQVETRVAKDAEMVLIVEDNKEVRAFISQELGSDYSLLEADNGKEGLALAQQHIPDLIITDVMMPEMDGFEFTEKVRLEESTSHIPLIMLTGKTALSDKLEGLEHGADAYMPKPFSIEELKVRIQQLILQRKKLRERFSKAAVIAPLEVSDQSIDQQFIEKISQLITEGHDDPLFGVSDLARAHHMSESQLNRKLKALIDQSPGELIRNYRLQKAAEMLKANTATISEISFQSGFNDQAYFSRAFKKAYGVSPSVYRKEKGL